MSHKTTYKGKWWLPNNARKKISGTLEVDESGEIVLVVDGQFLKITKVEDASPDVILGITNQGLITLYRNNLTGNGFRIEGYKFTSYQSQYILTEGHFKDLEKVKFKKATLSYSGLFNWLHQASRQLKHTKNKLLINNTEPKEFRHKINDDITLELTTYLRESGSPISPIKITIQEVATLTFKFKESKSFAEILSLEGQVRNFIRFVLTKETYLTGFYIDRNKSKRKKYVPSTQIIQSFRQAPSNREVSWFEMLFTYGDLEKQIGEIFINWFSKYKALEPIYNLYFNAFYSDITVLDQSFLNAIQALEAYHRRTKSNIVLPKAQHNRRIKTIVNAVPSDYQEWLAKKLAFSNEPTLTSRINDILSDFNEVNMIFIADPEFSNKVKNYRNRLTHYEPKKTKEPIDYDDLFKQWNKLRVLLDCCLLKEVGLSTKLITTLIRRKYIHSFNYLNH